MSKIKGTKTSITTCQNQSRNFNTIKNINIYFCLTEFSAAKKLICKCHVYYTSEGRYDMIISRDLTTAMGLEVKI